MLRIALLASTVGYCGYAPVAPGTVGSLVGLLLHGLVRWSGASSFIEAGLIVGLLALGCWSATLAERHLARRDPGVVVIDEVVGMLITVSGLAVGWSGALAGLALFRGFDVVKPFPARRLERLPGGWGIMADDVIAAVYAHAALRVLQAWAPGWVA